MIKQLAYESLHTQKQIDTIYFGGGTPSLLSIQEITLLLGSIKKHYLLSSEAEITLEANPDDISFSQATDWLGAGVNRLSIGVQSFFEQNLVTMNRAHNAVEAINAIHNIKKAGFDNFSVDLMFALPDLTDEMWANNLKKIIELKVPHVSCYNLTIKEQTALSRFIETKKLPPLSEEASVRQFTIAMQMLSEANYEQYEISNYCLASMESKHNSAYWSQIDYLGIGPGAHSYINEQRTYNVAHNMHYIEAIESNNFSKEQEHLTAQNKFNEYILTRLRTKKGISLKEVQAKFPHFYPSMQKVVEKQQDNGAIVCHKGHVQLTKKGKYLADEVALTFFA